MSIASLIRLSYATVAIPALIFFIGWLQWYVTIPLLIIICSIVCWIWRNAEHGNTSIPLGALISIFAIAFIWVFLSGSGGFTIQSNDYLATNALLKALVQSPWPLFAEFGNGYHPVVYYLGHLLPSAIVGKYLGWNAALSLQFLWTWMMASLIFMWLYILGKQSPKTFWVTVLLFVLWGGTDLIGITLTSIPPESLLSLERWGGVFEYSGMTTLLFWVPQQALYAWLATAIFFYIYQYKEQVNQSFSGLLFSVVALMLLYSPFGLVGLLILSTLLFSQLLAFAKKNPLLTIGNSIIGAVLALYVSSNSFDFPIRFLPAHYDVTTFLLPFALFLGVEIAPSILLIVLLSKKRHSPLLILSIALLCLLPLWQIGVANDFLMRVSIAPLFILCFETITVLQEAFFRRDLALHIFMLIYLTCTGFVGYWQIKNAFTSVNDKPAITIDTIPPIQSAEPYPNNQQRKGKADSIFWEFLARTTVRKESIKDTESP